MSDMRKLMNLVEAATSAPESAPLTEFVDPLSIGTVAVAGSAARLLTDEMVRRLAQIRNEASQLYHVRKWSLEDIIKKYWPKTKPGSKSYEKKLAKVKMWLIGNHVPLRDQDEPKSWNVKTNPKPGT